MFCPQCGASLPDDSKFCGSCGTTLAAAPTPVATFPQQPYGAPQNYGAPSYGAQPAFDIMTYVFPAAALLIAFIALFIPWLDAGLSVSLLGSYTEGLGIFAMFSQFTGGLSSLGSGLDVGAFTVIGVLVTLVCLLLTLAAIVLGALTIWRTYKNQPRHQFFNGRFALLALAAAFVINNIFLLIANAVLNGMVSSSFSSAGLSSYSSSSSLIFLPSVVIWVFLVITVLALVAQAVLKKN